MIANLTDRQIAQLNVGRLAYDKDDPRVAPFMDAIDVVNAVAERSPGFVWRFTGEGRGPGATDVALDPNDARLIVNLSVWDSVAALRHFVENTVHKRIMDRRGEWFEPYTLDGAPAPFFVMWPIAPGETPSLDDAYARLERLTREGPSDSAFGWREIAAA